jgi:anti-sigma factor RsiW
MDGEHLTPDERHRVEAHTVSCAACGAFERTSARVRTALRIRPAEPVPDLTEAILARIAEEAPARPLPTTFEPIL